jgi:acetolactate synthase-1/3 small subunit
VKQLHKLINIIKVYELTGSSYVQRELSLIKVQAKPEHRAEILRIVDIFRCKVIDVGQEHYTLEVTGDEGKMTAILNLLRPIGIKEIAKTGVIALFRESNGN